VSADAVGSRAVGAEAAGALAIGALAVGAVALGAVAIGRLAVRRMVMANARIGSLEIDELHVRRLRVDEIVSSPEDSIGPIHVEASAVIAARPETVYGVLADYHRGHPAILPRPPFTGLTVEQGGRGAGTVINVRMRALGRERSLRLVVSEPDAGRVLEEANTDAGIVTTFTVDPTPNSPHSRVTIATDARGGAGLAGWLERRLAPRLLRRVYQRELEQLARYVAVHH
jgi:hypothetical protein